MSIVPISTIVNVQISRQSQGVTQAGFGVPLILTDEDSNFGGDLVRTYLNLDEVLEDFASSTDTYAAAAAIFAQSPRVRTLKIGAEGNRVAQQTTLTFSENLVAGNTVSQFTITLGGQTETVTATAFNATNAQTLTDLAAKIAATAAIAGAVSDGVDTITLTSAFAGASFDVSEITVAGGAAQADVEIEVSVANAGPAEFLAAIREEDDDWYGLIWIERNERLVQNAAAYIETQRKIYITCTDDADVLDANDTDDIATILSGANLERTAVIYNDPATDFADAAWMGKCFTFDPGNETWKFKTLATITADNLNSTERAAATEKTCNLYVTIGGLDMTQEGKMASGEFIDIIRGTDWLQARMEERIYFRLKSLPKVPYTDAGIAIIQAEMIAVLENAIRESVLSPDPLNPDSDDRVEATRAYIIEVPRAIDVNPNDRAARLLPDITFRARLAGAIHNVIIQGTVSI